VKPAASSIEPVAAHDVRNALAGGIARLTAGGVPSAALAAELLLMHILGRDRAWLYAHPEHSLAGDEIARYAQLLEQRAAGAPTQYLTGRQEFWGLEFEVTPSVLIPRPETEHLIEVALARLGPRRTGVLRVADVGTGSGCLAVALARKLSRAHLVATDISAAALEVARRNAARHGVAGRIEFMQMNLLESYLTSSPSTRPHFDLIVSNPPYIGHREAAQLPREVREHEPPEALFSGPHGVEAYPPLIAQAGSLLRGGGLLVVELGYNAAERVRLLLDPSMWSGIEVTRDLAGIERVVSADRSAKSSA
jgi:release factor glutamine methyltransferase